jgi:hypothetical protein
MIAIFSLGEKYPGACNRNSYSLAARLHQAWSCQEQEVEVCDWLRSEAGDRDRSEFDRRDIFLRASALLIASEKVELSLRQLSSDQHESLELLEILCGECIELSGFAEAAEAAHASQLTTTTSPRSYGRERGLYRSG